MLMKGHSKDIASMSCFSDSVPCKELLSNISKFCRPSLLAIVPVAISSHIEYMTTTFINILSFSP